MGAQNNVRLLPMNGRCGTITGGAACDTRIRALYHGQIGSALAQNPGSDMTRPRFSVGDGKIVVVGVGGMGRTVFEWILDAIDDSARLIGFLDDDATLHGQRIRDVPILGGVAWLNDNPGTNVVVGVARPVVRRRIVLDVSRYDVRCPTLIHPSAVVARDVAIGAGSIIGPGCSISTNSILHDHVFFNALSKLGHDSAIGRYTTVAPGALISGNDHLGEGVEVGTGAIVLQGLSVGDWAMVGAGSLINKDVPANVSAVGMPAREIRRREVGWHLAETDEPA